AAAGVDQGRRQRDGAHARDGCHRRIRLTLYGWHERLPLSVDVVASSLLQEGAHGIWFRSSMATTCSRLAASRLAFRHSLVRRRPRGDVLSIFSASLRASASSSASGTTVETSPRLRARSAWMKRPVSRSSDATEAPTRRGRK